MPLAVGTFDLPIALVSDYAAIQRYACFAHNDGVLHPTPNGLPTDFPYEWRPDVSACCHLRWRFFFPSDSAGAVS